MTPRLLLYVAGIAVTLWLARRVQKQSVRSERAEFV